MAAFTQGAWGEASVWDREALSPSDVIEGPAVVEETFATHWIAPGWTARLAAGGTLIAKKEGA